MNLTAKEFALAAVGAAAITGVLPTVVAELIPWQLALAALAVMAWRGWEAIS